MLSRALARRGCFLSSFFVWARDSLGAISPLPAIRPLPATVPPRPASATAFRRVMSLSCTIVGILRGCEDHRLDDGPGLALRARETNAVRGGGAAPHPRDYHEPGVA